MRMHCALRLAGRARSVDEHQHILGLGHFRLGHRRLLRQQFLPPVVAAWRHLYRLTGALRHDDVFQRVDVGCCFVSNWLHLDCLPAPVRSIRCEKCFGPGIVHPRDNCSRAVSAKEWQNNSANFGNR